MKGNLLIFSRNLLNHKLKTCRHMGVDLNAETGSALFQQLRSVSSAKKENELIFEDSKTAAIGRAMRAYLQRSIDHKKFMSERITEYDIGKRHLANMMGEDPETFTQENVNNAIAYLLPSSLFNKEARPLMIHPLELYTKKKEVEFDKFGRPLHSLFYTGRPAYYSLLQEVSIKGQELSRLSSSYENKGKPEEKMITEGSKWISKAQLEEKLFEVVLEEHFEHLIKSLERLADNPRSSRMADFINKFRVEITAESSKEEIPQLLYTEEGIPYMTADGKRKMASAHVEVYGSGSGKFKVNGEDILYFEYPQDREQIMFPLQLTGLLKKVDVEATTEGGGKSGQAGALRYAISLALRSFVSEMTVEKMRIAGLLTRDARKKERKKPGQRRARAKFTWKKR